MTTPTRAAWEHRAACAGLDVDTFYPADGDARGHRAAVAVCLPCPVRAECLAAALDAEGGRHTSSRHGIRGGLTPAERRRAYERNRRARHRAEQATR